MNNYIGLLLLPSLVIPAISHASADVSLYDNIITKAQQPFNNCLHNFYNGGFPVYEKNFKTLNKDSYALCFNGFAVNYSGVSKTPLWSAEYLNIDRLRQASQIDREDSFHVEERVAPEHRATLSDYKGSGFDRGHLSPNADMANKAEQHDSFSLANITPQDPKLNRELWREVEYVTRGLVYKHNEVWVVTGVAFNTKKVKILNNNVLVPSEQFKAIYIPSKNIAGAYFAPNNNSRLIEIISIDELKSRTGLDAFPAISTQVKAQVGQLPFPNYDNFESPASQESISTPTIGNNQRLDDSTGEYSGDNTHDEAINVEETKNILFKIIAILKKIFSILG